MLCTIFDYFYRDAGNHKAFGSCILSGRISNMQQSLIFSKFDSGSLFVAEQIDVPVLYDQLYRWSGGPTPDDHCWHEWSGFRQAEEKSLPKKSYKWGAVSDFVAQIEAVEFWNGGLSPHFSIGCPIHDLIVVGASL